ncbi:MAG TPA: ATP-binding protein [Vicinamibacterales bacterium]|nr:ATP-binding protein [Vicinamibacterales bacterium]
MPAGPVDSETLAPRTAVDAAPEAVELSWLVTVRWATLTADLGAILAGRSGLDGSTPLSVSLPVLAVFATSNAWLAWRIRRRPPPAAVLTGGLVCADVLLLSWLLNDSGGVLNPVSIFYLVDIVLAALVLGRTWTWIVAALSIAGYATLFLRPSADLAAAQAMHPEIALHLRGMWIAFVGAALIVAVLVARLAAAIERRDRALDVLRDRANRSARLAGLATLAAGAAHELSTPLATMTVAAHELERAVGDTASTPLSPAMVQDDVRLIRAEIDRCRAILDGMAGRIAEPMGAAPREQPLASVIDDVLGQLATADRARVQPAPLAADMNVSVQWPAGAVARAIANLVRNALQASPDGAPVRVEATCEPSDRVRIAVRDAGAGMSAEELGRAGEPFFTTKPAGHGMGLGLFVSRSVVEQLGGSLTIASTPGAGTVASIVLPRLATHAEALDG